MEVFQFVGCGDDLASVKEIVLLFGDKMVLVLAMEWKRDPMLILHHAL